MTSNANLIIPDTSVLISDRGSVAKLINGENLVVVPLTVLVELDGLKNDSRIGSQARMAIKELETLVVDNDKGLIIEKEMLFTDLFLQKDKADYQIIATFNYVLKNKTKYGGYQKYKLVSEDINMRLIAHSLFKNEPLAMIENYVANTVELKKSLDLPIFSAQKNGLKFDYSVDTFGEVMENSGVLIDFTIPGEEKNVNSRVLTMRKGNKLEILSTEIQVMGLKPFHKGEVNWNQLLAFHQLMDKGIQCLFLQGPAGTGKTLLTIAAALEQKSNFEQLILVNPMVPLSNQNKLGFLPGDLQEKVSPWLAPFIQNIRFLENKQKQEMAKLLGADGGKPLKSKKSSKEFDEKEKHSNLWEKYGFNFQPLDFIRGQTITNAVIIVEEAQNLTQHDMKTIITRAGEGTKLIFCGDLSQVDLPYLTANKSGFTYAIEKISGTSHNNKMVGVCNLTVTVRSKLAAFASEMM